MVLTAGITGSATGLTVDTTVGLPSAVPFKVTLDPGLSREEIVKVTQVAGLTLTIVRGQDGTAGQPHDNGAQVRHMFTAEDARLSRQHEAAVTGVHGTVSALVGVNDSQVLTNKTINGTNNTITNVPKTALPSDTLYATTNVVLNASDVTVGDAASTVARAFRILTKASTGTNTYEGLTYLGDPGGGVAALVTTLKENGVEKGRTTLFADGSFGTSGNVAATGNVSGANLATPGDVSVGALTDTVQRTVHVYRKASTGTKAYELQSYVASGGTADTCYGAQVLRENGAEVARTVLQPDGTFKAYGDVNVVGTVTAANLSRTGWLTTGFTAGVGWSQSTSAFQTVNGITTLHFRFTRSGGNIVIGASGNIADDNAITIPTAIRSGFTIAVSGLVNIQGGGTAGWMGKITAGVLYVTNSTNPNITWTTGSDFYGTVTYIV